MQNTETNNATILDKLQPFMHPIILTKNKVAETIKVAEKKIITTNNTQNTQNTQNIINNDKDLYIPKQEDTLFWCFYIIVNGETIYESNFFNANINFCSSFSKNSKTGLIAKQLKIDFIEKMRKNKLVIKKYKFDTLTNIENNLLNDNKITYKTFLSLCLIENINIIYVSKKFYIDLFLYENQNQNQTQEQHESPKTYIIQEISRENYGYKLATEESIDKIRNTLYKIELDAINKPIKAISAYKLNELVHICKKLDIEIMNKETNKQFIKNDIYQLVVAYFK